MCRTIWFAALLVAASTVALAQPYEDRKNVVTKEITFMVTTRSHERFTVVARYEGNTVSRVDVSGSDATVQHPIDTRRYAVTVSGVVQRSLLLKKGHTLAVDHRFDTEHTVVTRQEVFQNFKIFSQQDRSDQIDAFTKKQQELVAREVARALDLTIAEDEPQLIRSVQERMNAVEVRKTST